jgi:acyl dehydratase
VGIWRAAPVDRGRNVSAPTVREIRRVIGTEPLTSAWIEVRQDDMDGFARVTHDDDWMHTDPERARAEGLDGTIAFGFWTLSLLTRFLRDALGTEYPGGSRLGFNYGLDRVRFLAPLPVGSRVRGHLTLTDAREKAPGRILLSLHTEAEAEGRADPVMVADWLVLLVFGEG